MPKQTPMSSYEQLVAEVDNDSPFYQVPKEMALKAIHARLTASDWALWTYVQVFDPHGDRMKQLPEIVKIAQTIGVSERQAQRSLAKLKKLELYDWEPVVIRGQNLAGKKAKELAKQKREAKSSDESKMTKLSESGQSCQNQDKVVPKSTKLSESGQSCRNLPLEPPPDKPSSAPHTYSDYSNLIQTLSEGEREKFEKFVRIEWKKLTTKNGELGEEIVSLERFLAREEDIKNWHQRFLNSPAGESAKKQLIAQTDWTQHPEWSDWLAIMREGVPRFVALGTCFDNKTRRAIADWADERGLIWGAES